MPKYKQIKIIENIYNYYKTKIQPTSISIKVAAPKINGRLKTYSEDQLIESINLFSNDPWWMEHCSTKGSAWFFNSDARIERFLGIKPRKNKVEGVYKEDTKTDYSKKTIKVND